MQIVVLGGNPSRVNSPDWLLFAKMAACGAWLRSLQQSRMQLMGVAAFGWSTICLTCIACYMLFPDKSSLPSMLLALVFGSLIMVAVFRVLISDRCKRHQEHVQEHIWASTSFEALEAAKPQFHRVQIRSSETSKGTTSATVVLEEVKVLYASQCKQHTCICCLEDFKPVDKVSVLPCGHIFHEGCHVDWHLAKKCGNACPICRDNWAIV